MNYAESKTSTPAHIERAAEMAHIIFGDYDPVVQNEVIKTIIDVVRERRHHEINEVKERLKYLEDSLSDMP